MRYFRRALEVEAIKNEGGLNAATRINTWLITRGIECFTYAKDLPGGAVEVNAGGLVYETLPPGCWLVYEPEDEELQRLKILPPEIFECLFEAVE